MCQAGGEKSVLLAARFFHPGRRLDVGVPRRGLARCLPLPGRGLARCRPLPGRGLNSLRLGGMFDMRARTGRHGVPSRPCFLAKRCREGSRASNVPPSRTGFLARRTSRRARGGSNTQPPAFCGSFRPRAACVLRRRRLRAVPACGNAGDVAPGLRWATRVQRDPVGRHGQASSGR